MVSNLHLWLANNIHVTFFFNTFFPIHLSQMFSLCPVIFIQLPLAREFPFLSMDTVLYPKTLVTPHGFRLPLNSTRVLK